MIAATRRPPRALRHLARRLRYAAGFAALRVLQRGVRALPVQAIVPLSRVLGSALYVLLGESRRRALVNLRRAFGEDMSPRKRRAAARGMFTNLARTALEFLALRRVLADATRRGVHVDWSPIDHAMQRGRGVVLVTGHFGNWELLAAMVAQRYSLTVIAKRFGIEEYNEAVQRCREAGGCSVVYADEGPRKLLRVLRDGGCVGVLPDQDIKRMPGVFVDFFGIPAKTPPGPMSLARAARAPVLCMFLVRGQRRDRVEISPVYDIDPSLPRDQAVLAATRWWTAHLEDVIRRHPDHWVWIHRRWRSRPENTGAAGSEKERA